MVNMKVKVKRLQAHTDDRGWLAEIIRPEDVDDSNFGQIHITVVNPGKTRGKHYHKRRTEWFSVIKGEGILYLRDMKNGIEEKIKMSGKNLSLAKIPPLLFHSFENTGQDEMYLLVYGDEPFKLNNQDTYNE